MPDLNSKRRESMSVGQLVEAVKASDMARVRTLLAARPELIGMDVSEGDEHRALHHAVLARNRDMVQLLMEAGADARKGIWPHRDATSAWVLARDREFDEIVEAIEDEERKRREEMSCPNATVSPVQDRISAAIAHGDDATARLLLEQDGSLIHACDREGATPLHRAAEEGNVAMVRWLMERRAKVNKEDLQGLTPLDRAALAVDSRNPAVKAFRDTAELLLGGGAKLTFRAAVALGEERRVREMIEAKPELLRETGNSGGALTLAVNHGQAGVARLLLELGADVDERIFLESVEQPVPSWGMPLWHAAKAGDLAMTRLLLDHGADPNANVYASGWPLLNAWRHADPSVKNLLLEKGAKPQPYMLSEMHDVEGARKLLEAEPSEGLATELAWSAGDHGCPEMVALAIPYLQWQPDDQRWHWILIQPIRGAEKEAERHLECMAVLLRQGVSPNVMRMGQTALHFAAGRLGELSDKDRARFATLLLDYGARLDLRDDLLRSTPLGWACRWGRQELARVLVERGADINEAETESWAKPLRWAEKMGHGEIVSMLGDATGHAE